jgi:hypothetical protein
MIRNLCWRYPSRCGCCPNLPIKCSSICGARFMLGRSNLATGRSLMHGVAPHMCWSSSLSIVRRRCRGSLPRHTLSQTLNLLTILRR